MKTVEDFFKANLDGINLLDKGRKLGGKPLTEGVALSFQADNWLDIDTYQRDKNTSIKYAVAVATNGTRFSLAHLLRSDCGLDEIFNGESDTKECVKVLDDWFASRSADGVGTLTPAKVTQRSTGGVSYVEWEYDGEAWNDANDAAPAPQPQPRQRRRG